MIERKVLQKSKNEYNRLGMLIMWPFAKILRARRESLYPSQRSVGERIAEQIQYPHPNTIITDVHGIEACNCVWGELLLGYKRQRTVFLTYISMLNLPEGLEGIAKAASFLSPGFDAHAEVSSDRGTYFSEVLNQRVDDSTIASLARELPEEQLGHIEEGCIPSYLLGEGALAYYFLPDTAGFFQTKSKFLVTQGDNPGTDRLVTTIASWNSDARSVIEGMGLEGSRVYVHGSEDILAFRIGQAQVVNYCIKNRYRPIGWIPLTAEKNKLAKPLPGLLSALSCS